MTPLAAIAARIPFCCFSVSIFTHCLRYTSAVNSRSNSSVSGVLSTTSPWSAHAFRYSRITCNQASKKSDILNVFYVLVAAYPEAIPMGSMSLSSRTHFEVCC